MGDNAKISVELASLKQAASAMDSQVVAEITSLSHDWTSYLGKLDQSLWSSEDACLAFGTTYVSAVQAYDQVLQGMKKDIVRYHAELEATYAAYLNQDDSVVNAMNARLAKLDDISAGDEMGRAAYGQRKNLNSDPDNPSTAPAAPTDTSPEA